MIDILDRIRNLNFTDSVAVKNLLGDMVHHICDEKLGTPRLIPEVEATLATRALNLNSNDVDEMRLLLVDMCKLLGKPKEELEDNTSNNAANTEGN